MRARVAEAYFTDISRDGSNDRAPGLPLLGFIAGTMVSLGLWVLIGLVAFRLFA